LTENMVKISAEVNEKGHSFKAVNENDITAAAKEMGIEIEPTMILISKPIKEVGEHEIGLVLGSNKASVVIEVVKK
jgi:ribosomal protein L9